MPGKYELRGDTIYCQFDGVLSLELILEGRRWIQFLPKEPMIFKLLMDLTEVGSSTITPDQASRFANTRMLADHGVCRAIVARAGSFGYGMARMFQSYGGIHLGDFIQVFTNQEAALEWLNLPSVVKDIPSR